MASPRPTEHFERGLDLAMELGAITGWALGKNLASTERRFVLMFHDGSTVTYQPQQVEAFTLACQILADKVAA